MSSNNTETRDLRAMDFETQNIYETVAIIAKRSNQIGVKIKDELNAKLSEFAPASDNLEEVFENREQIEISKHYERMPKPTLQAIDEFNNGKTYFRTPSKREVAEIIRMLAGKKIVLAITGSIAAYKSAYLVRALVKSGAEVRVIATRSALDFVTPITLATLSNNPVHSEYLKNEQGEWVNHVELGLWADLMIIAPATANTLSKMAHGQCDNLLMAVYLSARCPVMFAPAMDLDMYKHPSTQSNIQKLQSFGNILIPPGNGPLASGLSGEGRMAEPEEIQQMAFAHFVNRLPLRGKKILITAGPTYEAIDPVRFIGNRSTGKMGYALATACIEAGAEVTLISGPSSLPTPRGVKRIDVESAHEMYEATLPLFANMDWGIFSAAVADYRASEISKHKIKKASSNLELHLEPTVDILAAAGKTKQAGQRIIGFALETNDEIANAQSKLLRKNADLIVLNSLQDPGAGFAGDTNKVTLIESNQITALPLMSKQETANQIVSFLYKWI